MPYSVISGTYPDYIFESLASETPIIVDLPKNWPDDHAESNKLQRGLKRIIDIVGASLALILFSPIMLMTAVAVGLTSPGPVIFRQVRLGRGGSAFTFYKFRSMFCNADDRIHRDYVTSLIRKGGQSVDDKGEKKSTWTKLPYDPRVTPVGKIIRDTKLDELPQLFNVLKGDLSLVGPRPPLPYEVENYEAWHFSRILRAKPGITGIWQIEGRDDTTFDDMVRMDLRYVRTWSVLLDLKILMKTALTVFRLGRRELTARQPSHGESSKPVRSEA
jgi:lipopolysaccharide/colanic/teichoic acid biosynthesis glycosyltransferase